jgi:hypothetical protein
MHKTKEYNYNKTNKKMGYAGQKAVSKVNMILKDKSCSLPKLKLGNPLKKKGCSKYKK